MVDELLGGGVDEEFQAKSDSVSEPSSASMSPSTSSSLPKKSDFAWNSSSTPPPSSSSTTSCASASAASWLGAGSWLNSQSLSGSRASSSAAGSGFGAGKSGSLPVVSSTSIGKSLASSASASATPRSMGRSPLPVAGFTKKACLQREQRTRTPPSGTRVSSSRKRVSHCSQVMTKIDPHRARSRTPSGQEACASVISTRAACVRFGVAGAALEDHPP